MKYLKLSIKNILYFLIMTMFISGCDISGIPEYDRHKAYSYLREQCEFGARVPNSEAHKQCEDYLYLKLSATTSVCRKQKFIYYDQIRDDSLYLTNIIASYNPEDKHRILLCAHWDCRPWADEETDSSLHSQPVMGANDGASGVAVLLVIAEIFKNNPPPVGVDIVFFDGEDYGQSGNPDQWLLGSKYFVKNIGGYRPYYVILVDLIGDSDLNIHKEQYSQTHASWLVSRVWKAAALENAEHFLPDIGKSIYDDHIPFLEIGIPAVDIIDIDYESWHTIHDTPDKCSPESLGEVGRVVLRMVYDKEFNQ